MDEGILFRPKSRMYASRVARGDNRRFVYARKIRPETASMASDALVLATIDGNWPDWTDMLMASAAVLAEDYDRDEAECIAAEAMELLQRQARSVNRHDPLEREKWERQPYISYYVERDNRWLVENREVPA